MSLAPQPIAAPAVVASRTTRQATRPMVAALATTLAWTAVATSASAASASVAAAAAASATDADDDDDPPLRLSLPTQADREAWTDGGFRLELGLRWGATAGLDGRPDGDGFGVLARFGVRLDPRWSLAAAFHYAAVSGQPGRDLLGLRYLGLLEPTWHPWSGLTIAVGVGMGGMVEGGSLRDEPDGATRDALVAPLTLPAGSAAIPSCTGVGPAAALRVGWRVVLGPIAAMGLDAQVDAGALACVDDTSRVEPDTATAIVRRQWWTQTAWSLALVWAWR